MSKGNLMPNGLQGFQKGNKLGLGRKFSLNTKEIMRQKRISWFKTHAHPNLGKHRSEVTKEKIKQKRIDYLKNNPMWNKGLTKESDERVRKNAKNIQA